MSKSINDDMAVPIAHEDSESDTAYSETLSINDVDVEKKPTRRPAKKKHRRIVKVTSAAATCIDGHYLPLLTDKIRNNVRSRPLLVGMYMVGTAFVSVLLVIAFSFTQNLTLKFTSPVNPPRTLYLGEVAPLFSAQVRDHNLEGVAGMICVLSVVPIAPFDLDVTLNEGLVTSRSINCLQSLLEPGGINTMDDFLFCNPAMYPGGLDAVNRMTVTNHEGVCTFTSFTIGFGTEGTYLMLMLLVDSKTGSIVSTVMPQSFFISVKSGLQSINPRSSNVFLPHAQIAGFPVQGMMGGKWATFAPNLTAEVIFAGSSESASIGTVCAAVLSLNLQKTTNSPASVLEPPIDTMTKSIAFSNFSNVACTSNITQDDAGLFHALLTWPNIVMIGANSKQLYFGLSSLGTTIALNKIDTPSYYPSSNIYSQQPITNVATVVARGLPPNISETEPLASVAVTVTDAAGMPVANRVVFLMSRPSAGAPVAGSHATLASYANPKHIMFGIALSNASGVATFAQSIFSCSGGVGVYEVLASCDGITAAWPEESAARNYSRITVTSSADPSSILYEFIGGELSNVEIVGQPWNVLPVVKIVSKAGISIPGKVVDIRPVDPEMTAGVTKVVPSGNDGTAYVVSYVSSFLNSPNPNVPVVVPFYLVVDDMIVFVFNRTLMAPTSVASACMYVQVRNPLPKMTYTGVQFIIQTTAVTGTGQPVSDVNVSFTITPEFIAPAPGQNTTIITNTTDNSGNAYFTITARGVPLLLGLYGTLACSTPFPAGVSASYNYLAMALASRVMSVLAAPLDNESIGVQVSVEDWTTVSPESPISVTATVQWLPSYVDTSYMPPDIPIPSTVFVTGPQDSFARLTMANKPITPGLFGLVLRVDTSPFPPYLPFNIVTPQIVLTLEKSFSAVNDPQDSVVTVTRGVLPQQPSVKMFGAAPNGTMVPIPRFKVFAQLVVNLTNGSTVIQHLGNPDDLVLGTAMDGNFRVSQPADAAGFASFSNLAILAAVPGVPFSFRYCVGTNIQTAIFSDAFDVCVNDTVWGILSFDSSVGYVTSTSVLTGTQGQFLPPITVFAVASIPQLFFCTAQLLDEPKTALLVPQTYPPATLASGSSGSAVTFQYFLTPSTSLDDGVYVMRFVCSGGVSNNVSIVLSAMPASISILLPPPAQSPVLTVIPVEVQLLSPSAKPVSNIYVAAYVSPTNKACLLSSCGVLDPSSIIYAQTANDGTALFTFILDRGDSQPLRVVFLEGDQRSELAVSQAARDAYRSATSHYGVPRAVMTAGLKSRVPQLIDFLNVMDEISGTNGGWSSSTTLTPTSGQTSGPLERIQQLFGGAPTPAFAVANINLVNRITNVVIHSQPPPATFVLPFSVSALSATVAPAPTMFSFSQPFVIEFVAVGGRRAIDIYPLIADVDCDGCDVTVQQAPRPLNDTNSTTITVDISFAVTTPCSFRFWFTGLGGGGNFSAVYTVALQEQASRTDYMKLMAAFLVLLFSPMLASTVPHASRCYAGIALVAVGLMLAGTWWSQTLLPPNDPFYLAYWIFLVSITSVVSAGFALISLIDFLSYGRDVYCLRFVNDEGKALKTYDYTQWLINARASRQPQPDDTNTKRPPNILQRKLSGFAVTAAEKINSLSMRDIVDLNSPTRRLRKKCVFQYDHEHLNPVYLPINFLIVVAISLVLLILLNFITVFLYRELLRYINMFLTYLPSVSENASIDQANAIVIYAITRAIEVTVQQFPQYAKLGEIVGPLQSVNIVSLLTQFRAFVAEGLLRLEVAFIVASCMAFLVYTGTLATTALAIPSLIRQVRRGQLEVSSSMSSLEGYIGLHCWQLLVVYQIVFWPVAIICFLLSISYVRQFLYDKLLVLVASSAVAYLISFGLNTVFVQKFLCAGSYTVVRNELYSVWHYVGLILGVFTGFMSSVVRWGKSVAFISLLFARLDYAIYPELFASADTAHGGFMSVVNVEAKNGNPIYVTFCTLLLLEPELRRIANSAQPGEEEVPAAEIFRGSTVASSIRNVARIFVRDLSRAPHDLRDRGASKFIQVSRYREDHRRSVKERVRHRFWLAMMLINNPSLVGLRKHRLYEDEPTQ